MDKGKMIKSLREIAGLSQVELADLIGVSKQTLYKYENNIITNIPSDKIEAIASVLKTEPGIIMGWKSSAQTESEIVKRIHNKLLLLTPENLKTIEIMTDALLNQQNNQN